MSKNIKGQITDIIQDIDESSAQDIQARSFEKELKPNLDALDNGETSALVHEIVDSLDPTNTVPYYILCTPVGTHDQVSRLTEMCIATPAVWLYSEARPVVGSEVKIRFDNSSNKTSATYMGPASGLGSLYDAIDIVGIVQEAVAEALSATGNNIGNDPSAILARVLQVAGKYSGGVYRLDKAAGNGVPSSVFFNSEIIAKKTPFVYCNGFTFAVVIEVAKSLKLLDSKSKAQIMQFKKIWYGASQDRVVRERQQGPAMNYLGIGNSIAKEQAKPGDFCQFWRTNKTGHSVVFKGWLEDDKGKRIGIKYRCAQQATGIADNQERFSTDGGSINQARIYFSRLNSKQD